MSRRRLSFAVTTSLLSLPLAAILLTGCGGSEARPEPIASSTPGAMQDDSESLPQVEPMPEEAEVAEAASEPLPPVRPSKPAIESVAQGPAPKRAEAVTAPVPVPDPEPVVRTVLVTIPGQTGIEVEIAEELSSETNLAGDAVRARVVRDVVRDGMVAIPAGSELTGAVTEAVAQKKIGGQASLALRFDRIELPSGDVVPVSISMFEAGRKQTKKDAATIGGSAAGGALLGRVLSKDHKSKGTAIGAAVGAAIGSAVAATNQGDPVVIPAGTVTELSLDESVEIALEVREPAQSVARN